MLSQLTNDQRKYLIDTAQMYESYIEAKRHANTYRHGMTWKKARNKEYLFRLSGRTGYGKSLGVRSEASEQILAEFKAGKEASRHRLDEIVKRLDQIAKINKALQLGRLPVVIAKLLRALDERGLLGEEFIVLGTNCLFAYEAVAGVRIDPSLTASGDIDLMYDARRKISIASQKLGGEGLIGLLRKIDKTFALLRVNSFRAANSQEFMVDLITPPRDIRISTPISFAEDDLVASEIAGLEWLMNSPKFEAVCIAEDGWPARMVVPDPRAFAIHKNWLSSRPERDPIKKPRDADQSDLVKNIVIDYFPHLPFEDEALLSFPVDLRRLY
jgi:hypothetical protein